MSRNTSTDTPKTPSLPPPEYEGRRLRSGLMRSLPITAGDQGDPNTDNPPSGVGAVEDGFLLASSTCGLRTTPLDRAIVVAGTPLRQQQRFVVGSVGSTSSSEDEGDSPPLLSVPATPVIREVPTVTSVGVYMQAMIARCVFVRICISLLDAYSYAYAYGTVR